MIKSLNFLGRPSSDKLNLFISIGTLFFVLGIIDVILNSFFEINITSVLPGWLSFFTPLIFSFIGLYYIRIEFSGNRILDNLNKNINSNWFNAVLSLLIIFVLIQNGFLLKFGFRVLYMGCIQLLKFGGLTLLSLC